MFTANQAKEITNSNKYKVNLTRSKMLDYMLSRIKQEANKGLSILELELSNPKDTDVSHSDYCRCVYNLRRAAYKVKHFENRIYISW